MQVEPGTIIEGKVTGITPLFRLVMEKQGWCTSVKLRWNM